MKKIKLPFEVKKPILACGADLKGAFAFAKGDEAVIADGFGDLADPDNLARYEKAARKYAAKAEIIACDLHPGYFSTRFAESLKLKAYSLQLCKVQHHEAHTASAIVDNAVRGDVIGVAFDGTGFGPDKAIWGGEFFTGNLRELKRAGHFEYVPMPGGEAAIREPWRMAVSYLYKAFGKKYTGLKIGFMKKRGKKELALIEKVVDKKLNSTLTSSAGRLFDGVASLVMAKDTASYEAELPIELQKLAFELCQDAYDFDIKTEKGMLVIGVSKIIKGVVKDLSRKLDSATVSSKFHNTVAEAIAVLARRLSKKTGITNVVLSGGVFQNRYLLDRTLALLTRSGLAPHDHLKLPTNDAGISIGQIAIANAGKLCA